MLDCWLAGVLFTTTSALSHAQTSHVPFVEGSLFLDSDTGGYSGPVTLTAGGAVDVGLELTKRTNFMVGLEIPRRHTGEHRTDSSMVGCQQQHRRVGHRSTARSTIIRASSRLPPEIILNVSP